MQKLPGHCQLVTHLGKSPKTTRSFVAELQSSGAVPVCADTWGYFSPGAGSCPCPCWPSLGFSLSQFSSLPRSSWKAAEPSGVSATPSVCVSKPAEGYPFVQVIDKQVMAGPSIDPWGTPLARGLQLDSTALILALWALPFNQTLVHPTVHSSNPYISLGCL